ncbi:hypothetical protein I4F81_012644 [Pyropia yezoensis]|uniref:Uncharacterized protein n=1 Tax=Pyropia yezoensis TaxID=2788 RepID=A0ACC3CIZ4_PYRYE|nr:hypothetical protein I4F81_012644 [Neopyropia yezoensis]
MSDARAKGGRESGRAQGRRCSQTGGPTRPPVGREHHCLEYGAGVVVPRRGGSSSTSRAGHARGQDNDALLRSRSPPPTRFPPCPRRHISTSRARGTLCRGRCHEKQEEETKKAKRRVLRMARPSAAWTLAPALSSIGRRVCGGGAAVDA